MHRAARDLRIWSRSLFSDAKMQLQLATLVVLRLDIAQESRLLTECEFCLRKALKLRILGLAAVERARKRQASRITWLQAGDAPTAFFQAKITSRARKNFIHSLQGPAGIVTAQEDKEKLIHDHFHSLLGSSAPRCATINWATLQLPQIHGGGLDNPFTESE